MVRYAENFLLLRNLERKDKQIQWWQKIWKIYLASGKEHRERERERERERHGRMEEI